MIFHDRIKSIKKTDRVLEVGPGGSPYSRSNVLLEKIFDPDEALNQRGHTDALETEQEIVYYSEKRFPFDDNEFDYVICSHVLEHIPENDFEFFINELQRVANNGYIEYPTIYYEYLYNFKVHTTFLNYKDNVIYYMDKAKSDLNGFFQIQMFFYKTLEKGYDEIIRENKEYFFQGFEWHDEINILKTDEIQELVSKEIKLTNVKHKQKKYIFLNRIKQLLRKLFK